MNYRSVLVGPILALVLAVGPVGGGIFDDFEDIGVLTDHLLSGGPGIDGIPAVTNPQFVDLDQIEYVQEHELVLGVVLNGEAKAYPENLGWWHEIINDRCSFGFT
jgi:hypothetical protein